MNESETEAVVAQPASRDSSQRIFGLLKRASLSSARPLLEILNEGINRSLSEDPVTKRMEHTILPPYESWHWRACVPVGSIRRGKELEKARSEFYLEPARDGGASLLLVDFQIKKKAAANPRDEMNSPEECVGVLSEPTETDLAVFLDKVPGALPVLEDSLRPLAESAALQPA